MHLHMPSRMPCTSAAHHKRHACPRTSPYMPARLQNTPPHIHISHDTQHSLSLSLFLLPSLSLTKQTDAPLNVYMRPPTTPPHALPSHPSPRQPLKPFHTLNPHPHNSATPQPMHTLTHQHKVTTKRSLSSLYKNKQTNQQTHKQPHTQTTTITITLSVSISSLSPPRSHTYLATSK
jgi:hypothetical protein